MIMYDVINGNVAETLIRKGVYWDELSTDKDGAVFIWHKMFVAIWNETEKAGWYYNQKGVCDGLLEVRRNQETV